MKIMYALVIIILIIAIVLTLLIAGKGDDNYSSSTKRNFTNLTLIYVVIIIFGLIALGIYISLFSSNKLRGFSTYYFNNDNRESSLIKIAIIG